jgi:hypothetical protein
MPKKRPIKNYAKSRKSLIPKVPEKVEAHKKLLFTFHQLDRNQGQTLKEWEDNKLLLPTFERLANLCTMTLSKAKGNAAHVLSVYDGFPPPDKTDFKHPKHIQLDAVWCSIHVKGEVCISAHIVNNHIINIVFLDRYHCFYKTKKKHT